MQKSCLLGHILGATATEQPPGYSTLVLAQRQ